MTGWKTFIFGIATIVLGVLQSTEVTTLVSQYPGAITTAIGIIVVIMRAVTSSAIFKN